MVNNNNNDFQEIVYLPHFALSCIRKTKHTRISRNINLNSNYCNIPSIQYELTLSKK